MKCSIAIDLLPLYVGDDLGRDGVAVRFTSQLEDHLNHCKLCEAEYAIYADARHALLEAKGGIDIESLASLWQSIDEKLPPSTSVFSRRRIIASLGLAASLLVMLLLPFSSQDAASLVESDGVVVHEISIPDNLNDIVPPSSLNTQQLSRVMSPGEVANYFDTQQRIRSFQLFEQSIVSPRFNQSGTPAASMVGLDLSTNKSL
ncbi:MAG TPA: hypothetical protein EYN86_06075 [Planctomycetes bacterium]|nr:hypothetical protein [Planctomycetota bacterium]